MGNEPGGKNPLCPIWVEMPPSCARKLFFPVGNNIYGYDNTAGLDFNYVRPIEAGKYHDGCGACCCIVPHQHPLTLCKRLFDYAMLCFQVLCYSKSALRGRRVKGPLDRSLDTALQDVHHACLLSHTRCSPLQNIPRITSTS